MAKFESLLVPVDTENSNKIQESGKDSGGTSSFICPDNTVMVGRWHKGDENGETQYKFSNLVIGDNISYYETGNVEESNKIQESGKDSGGTSFFICPDNTVMVDRWHEGDENGETQYKYVGLYFNDELIITQNHKWSDWIQESGKNGNGYSEFNCPSDTVITGREHKGDENGDTRYRYSEIYIRTYTSEIKLQTIDFVQSDLIKESSGVWPTVPVNKVMVGRKHWGDENGNTEYTFRYIFYETDDSIITHNHEWSDWIQESGKNGNGVSLFECPIDTVMTGRQHKGDENGDTRYRYSTVLLNNIPLKTEFEMWSNRVIESSGEWLIAPIPKVMVGRYHQGDENGETMNLYFDIAFNTIIEESYDPCRMHDKYKALGANLNENDEKPLYTVGWTPYLLDWIRYVLNGGPIFRYYSPKEIDGVGILTGSISGVLYGTNLKREICEEVVLYSKDEGHYSWVLSPGGDILYKWNSQLELDTRNYTRHSDLNQGEPVICAGEFYLTKGGNIFLEELYIELNDSSGHYKPNGKQCIKYVIEKFKEINIDTTRVIAYTRD